MMYTDVDECAENNGGCSQFATCTNTPGTFNCTCNMGYRGDGFNCSGEIIVIHGKLNCCENCFVTTVHVYMFAELIWTRKLWCPNETARCDAAYKADCGIFDYASTERLVSTTCL